MNEIDAWKNFITTGSVKDYLTYASIKNSNIARNPQEAVNENQHGRSGYSGTEYKGARQADHCLNKK